MSDHPRDCPHGLQWGHCDTCDLLECEEKLNKASQLLKEWCMVPWARTTMEMTMQTQKFLEGKDAE
jgi:hypothetical protein